MPKRVLTVPEIRKNPRIGKFTENDAAVVIGNSKPDIIGQPNGDQVATTRQSQGNHKATKRKPRRSQRVYFVPNKVTRIIIEQWKEKYGNRYYSAIINQAIESHTNR